MGFFGPPGIAADAARKALTPDEVATAHGNDVARDQAQLDEAELREVEGAEYYHHTPRAEMPPVRRNPVRAFVSRVLHRG